MPVSSRSSRTGRIRPVVQITCESASSRVRGVTAARIASGLGRDDDDPGAGRRERSEQAEVLVGRRHDLVVRVEPEPAEDDVAAVGRARRERDLQRFGADECRDARTQLVAQLHHAREVRASAAAVAVVALELRAASPRTSVGRSGRRCRH